MMVLHECPLDAEECEFTAVMLQLGGAVGNTAGRRQTLSPSSAFAQILKNM